MAWAVLLAAGGPALAAGPADPVSIPVEFAVSNVNSSGVSCASDGQAYRLHAELVGPRYALSGRAPATATLYLHEYSYDDFWHFRSVPGVDYATELARAGHVSVALDRLGYDDSPHPDGDGICIGSHADIARQIVAALRAGNYSSPALPARPFQRVVLAGHSVGGIVSQLAAISFGGVDALMLFAASSSDFSTPAIAEGVKQGQVCAAGGEESGGAAHYAGFAEDNPEFQRQAFQEADPAVYAAAAVVRHRDPCGDVRSLVPAAVTNSVRAGELKLPILLLWGRDDPVYTADAAEDQAESFSGSDDVTSVYFERSAHALTLQRTAPQVRSAVDQWLGKRGLVAARPVGKRPRLSGCPVSGRVLTGTDAADRLAGGAGAQSLFGLAGDDVLSGGAGNDCLSGGAGADRLDGGAGRDRLVAGPGPDVVAAADRTRDVISCGAGRDRAVVDRVDRVSGCERVRRRGR